MSRDCVVKLVKLEQSDSGGDLCKQFSSKAESVSIASATDARNRTVTLQKQSTVDEQIAVDQDTVHSMTDKEACEANDADSHTSDDNYMVIVDDYDDIASDFEVEVDEPSPSSCEAKNPDDASEKVLSSVGASASTSNIHEIETTRQYQPFVTLKRLDPAECNKWTAGRKGESGDRDKGQSRYAVFFMTILFCHCVQCAF